MLTLVLPCIEFHGKGWTTLPSTFQVPLGNLVSYLKKKQKRKKIPTKFLTMFVTNFPTNFLTKFLTKFLTNGGGNSKAECEVRVEPGSRAVLAKQIFIPGNHFHYAGVSNKHQFAKKLFKNNRSSLLWKSYIIGPISITSKNIDRKVVLIGTPCLYL